MVALTQVTPGNLAEQYLQSKGGEDAAVKLTLHIHSSFSHFICSDACTRFLEAASFSISVLHLFARLIPE